MRGVIRGVIKSSGGGGGRVTGAHVYSRFIVPDVGSLFTDVFYNLKDELQIRLSVYPSTARKEFTIYEGPFPTSKEDTLPHFAKMVQDALETES